MSRSYKKQPISKDNQRGGAKLAKRFANKVVRKAENLPSRQRAAYKKCFCTWNIHDYISRWTLQEAIDAWEEEETEMAMGKELGRYSRHARYGNLEAYLNAVYYKYYVRK